MRRELTAAVAVLMLASGLMLGVYYAPIEREIVTIFSTPTGSRADAGYAGIRRGVTAPRCGSYGRWPKTVMRAPSLRLGPSTTAADAVCDGMMQKL
jgi:hypothetical protein